MGVLIAIGVALPYFFHFAGIPGQVFLPMHIPALLGGFLLRSGGRSLSGGADFAYPEFFDFWKTSFPITCSHDV